MSHLFFRLLLCTGLVLVGSACRDAPQPALDDKSTGPKTLLPVEKTDQWGYATRYGRLIIEPQFEKAHRFVDNRALIRLEGKFGFIDTTGSVVISPTYTNARSFTEGFAPVRPDSLWGYVNRSGRLVIQPRFAQADPFRNGLARVALPNGQTAYVTPTDSLVRPGRSAD